MTHISFGANDVLHITDMDTDKTLSINSGTYSGDIEVANAYYYFNGLNELSDNEIAMDIEHGSRYSVTFETDSDFSISSNTDYYAFDMLGADSLDIDFESGATLKGDDIYYNSYISLGENDNLLNLTGSCNEQISFAKAENDTLSVQGKNNVLEKGKLFIDEKIEKKEINIENNSFVVSIDNDKIEILGHSMSEVSAVAPTCTADGNNKYYKCDICGKFFKDPEGKTATAPQAEKLAALGHTDADNDGKCDRCGKKLCDHICHSTNPVLKFFWKIINFFNKLFKINQYCKCGARRW